MQKPTPDVNWTGATFEVEPGLWAKQPRPCDLCGAPAQYGVPATADRPVPFWYCTEHWEMGIKGFQ